MNPASPRIRRNDTLRYPNADYSDPGVYFITTCTRDRIHLFGEIINDQMHCNKYGAIVWDIWNSLPTRYPQIELDAAVVMPDHFHGLIIIHEENTLHPKTSSFASGPDVADIPMGSLSRRHMTLSLVVGYFKMNAAKRINLLRHAQGSPVWQRNYYDQILRSDKDYNDLVEYILTNPKRWGVDKD